MRVVPVKRRDGEIDNVTVYNVQDFPWNTLKPTALKSRKRRKNPGEYLLEFCTFDIETTTIPGDKPIGFMYHFQWCINGLCLTGHTWKECMQVMAKLKSVYDTSPDRRLVVYIQNLGFEFQFINRFVSKYIGWKEIFSISERKPLRAVTADGIELRCSWKLSNMSLEKMCDTSPGVIHPKAKGDLDYKVIRTPKTELTDGEMGYCIADVLGLWEYISVKLKDGKDNLETIPMTSTGYVRRRCRKATERENGYREWFKKQQMTPAVYELLKDASRGGDTHANRYMSGKIHENVDSYDVQSSYPYVLCCKQFPMTKFVPYGEIETLSEFNNLLSEKACLFRVLVEKVELREEIAMPYISESKCLKYGKARFDNGRILKAEYLYMTMTDIDWRLFCKQYTFDEESLSIAEMHIADYDYLPDCLVNEIIALFEEKTKLKWERDKYAKGSDRYEEIDYLYMKSKNLLNGVFGMMYTDPVRETIIWNGEGSKEWKKEKNPIAPALEKFWGSRNSFLVYSWGVWTTAHAREHLAKLVDIIGQENSIYCDTDSDKGVDVDERRIAAANALIIKETEERHAYADSGGKRYYMGIYEHDAHYEKFKTLGAKKYCYEEEGELHITISGVAKSGAKELSSIDQFDVGFTFTQSAGNEFYYNDEDIHEIMVNGERIETASNIAMLDGTYTIGITTEYSELIGYNILKYN